ncbi:MAG: S41 family peptidase [Lysobacteraceae bacterium]
MNKSSALFSALLLCGSLSASTVSAQDAATEAPPADVDASEPAPADDSAIKPQSLKIDEIRRFVAVFRAVQQAYVEPVEDTELMQAAIRGLLTDLDPHSAYLSKDELASLSEFASGSYGGLGLEVMQQPDRSLVVISPIDDTPAARAGIQPGDVIIEIDGKVIDADSADAAVESMRGEPGTKISMTLMREGVNDPITVELTREVIRVDSVKSRILEPGYGYLRIATFQSDTGAEVKRHVAKLQADGQKLQGLVIDLRSNPGGLLNAAVEAADAFLDQGLIVSTRGRIPTSKSEYRAAPGDLLNGAPIVIIENGGTASASEVLAGALKDHHRAVVMGSVSFGKGSVQNVLPLDNGDAIKLTTARYYTPNGTSIQASGIVPDIHLAADLVVKHSGYEPPSIREADLPGHLDNDAPVTVGTQSASDIDDFAIREGLNLLKGLAVYRRAAANTPSTSTDDKE